MVFKLNRTGSVLNRSERLNFNENWDSLEKVISDRGLEILSESSFLSWLDENGVKHLGEWDDTKEYDRFSVVLHEGGSYTSKKRVPVGIDILNEEFWVITGNYNAQVEYYRDEVGTISDTLETKTDRNELIKNIKNYGLKGDGIVNEVENFQNALDNEKNLFIPKGDYLIEEMIYIYDDTVLQGQGKSSNIKTFNTDGNTIRVVGSNVIIRDLSLSGTSLGGIQIRNGVDNILIENCHFSNINQVIWLFECSNVTVQNCTFDSTGYGVIQQNGYSSSHVKVINNTCINSGNDFVECNSVDAISHDWVIMGNQYLGSDNYTDTESISLEKRFLGVTSVKSLIIKGNYIKNAGGDSAIHCEYKTGDVIISGNIFEDCKATRGNDGWIYLMGSTPDNCLVDSNIFIKNDNLYQSNSALECSSTENDNVIQFTNNIVVSKNNRMFNGVILNSHENSLVSNNQFINTDHGVVLSRVKKSMINNNKFNKCNLGIGKKEETPAGYTGDDIQVKGNVFYDTVIDLAVLGNQNGTYGNERWAINDNVFNGEVILSTNSNYNVRNKNFIFNNNTLSEGSGLSDDYIDHYVKQGNLKYGAGLLEG